MADPTQATDDLHLPERFRPGTVLGASDIEELSTLLAQAELRIQQRDQHVAELTRALEHVRQPPYSRLRHWLAPHARHAIAQMRITPGVQLALRNIAGTAMKAFDKPLCLFVVAFVIQLPLVLNLGYFSHDELQWLALADKPTWSQIPWTGWFDFQPFQYRPLTFNLWLLTSHYLGYQPIAMHLLRVLLGIVVAILLRAALVRFDVPARHAFAAACIFLLLPEVVFTNGWIGTYADALCAAFLLAAILWTLRAKPGPQPFTHMIAVVAAPIALLTILALLSKESAVILPALLLVAACKRRDRVLAIALAASATVVLAYLSLRLQIILFAPRDGGGYVWSIANIPRNLAEYALFPFLTHRLEVHDSYLDQNVVFAGCCVAVFLAAVAGAGWRFIAALCFGWITALGPVLILAYTSNNYAYLACAFVCAAVALAWRKLGNIAHGAVGLLVLVAAMHGYYEMKEIRHIGRVQYHLYKELPQIVEHSTAPVLIKAERIQEDFILQRVLYAVPSYRRIPFGDRVVPIDFADNTTTPTYLLTGDGRLKPAR